jgi:glycosyltransferase involved in cell wall biosynthesis
MRIGLISGEYPPMQGGVADYTRELAVALAALGHEVYILTDRRGTGRGDPGVAVGARVNNWNRAALLTVRRWARVKRLNVVNIQYQAAAYRMAGLVHLLPRLLKSIPVVTTFHDLRVPYLFPKAGALREKAVLELARGARAVIVTNREDGKKLQETHGIRRLEHIPIGSNITAGPPPDYDRAAWREKLGILPGEMLVGYFGFLNSSKGVETLLHATARARADGTPLRLLMIGGRTGDSDPTNAAYARQIDTLIETLGIAGQILWTGYVDTQEVSGHLYACDCCALPYQDGVSFRRGSFMAALAHGCPTITTTPAFYTPELVNGKNVYLIAPGSVRGLAVALQMLAAKPHLRQRLSDGARELAEHFTWDRIAAQTAALFEEIL